jgi:hypothetical protein
MPIAVLLGFLLLGCTVGRTEASEATAAAADFMAALESGNVDDAWASLSPRTREALYEGHEELLAQDLAASQGPFPGWEISGAPSWLDTSWAVPVSIVGGSDALPQFMLDRRLVGQWSEQGNEGAVVNRGVLILVERAQGGGSWQIAAIAYDG